MSDDFAREMAWIDALVLACGSTGTTIDAYLQYVYFTEASGRMLILQPAGEFGYLYLTPEEFDDPVRRQDQVATLSHLMTLLDTLGRRGQVVVAGKPGTSRQLRMVGARFQAPLQHGEKIVLNAAGDYSDHPELIRGADGRVLLKGVRLDDALYQLLVQHVAKSAVVSHDLARIAAGWRLRAARAAIAAQAEARERALAPAAVATRRWRRRPAARRGAGAGIGMGLGMLLAGGALAALTAWSPDTLSAGQASLARMAMPALTATSGS